MVFTIASDLHYLSTITCVTSANQLHYLSTVICIKPCYPDIKNPLDKPEPVKGKRVGLSASNQARLHQVPESPLPAHKPRLALPSGYRMPLPLAPCQSQLASPSL